jgi:hypothetical protein
MMIMIVIMQTMMAVPCRNDCSWLGVLGSGIFFCAVVEEAESWVCVRVAGGHNNISVCVHRAWRVTRAVPGRTDALWWWWWWD